jgi:probable rRNA maturation factor
MTLDIDFQDEGQSVSEEMVNLLKELLQYAAQTLNIGDAEMSITFVDNARIQEINKTYRDKDQPTDVISFAMEDEVEGEVTIVGVDMPRVLGDILISIPKAKEQAEEHGHSFKRELGFLALHGFLHLLGYDHRNEEDEKEMFGLQNELLNSFGLTRSS